MAGMSVRLEAVDVVGQPHVTVMAARRRGHVDRLPAGVVGLRGCPLWVITEMKSPHAIEQRRCAAQRWRICSAATREHHDRDCEYHQRRDDDAGDQLALWCVCRWRLGHHAI